MEGEGGPHSHPPLAMPMVMHTTHQSKVLSVSGLKHLVQGTAMYQEDITSKQQLPKCTLNEMWKFENQMQWSLMLNYNIYIYHWNRNAQNVLGEASKWRTYSCESLKTRCNNLLTSVDANNFKITQHFTVNWSQLNCIKTIHFLHVFLDLQQSHREVVSPHTFQKKTIFIASPIWNNHRVRQSCNESAWCRVMSRVKSVLHPSQVESSQQ